MIQQECKTSVYQETIHKCVTGKARRVSNYRAHLFQRDIHKFWTIAVISQILIQYCISALQLIYSC